MNTDEIEAFRATILADGFWFVDIPRTASTSLRVELGRLYGPAHGKRNTADPSLRGDQIVTDHLTAAEMRQLLGEAVWGQLFTFSFVRDPWSRTESMWRWRRREGSVPDEITLTAYVRALALGDVSIGAYPPHVADCLTYLAGPDGRLLVDFVGNFATRDDDLARIAAELPGRPSLGAVSTQQGDTEAIAGWTQEAIELVGRVYAADIAAFGMAAPGPVIRGSGRA